MALTEIRESVVATACVWLDCCKAQSSTMGRFSSVWLSLVLLAVGPSVLGGPRAVCVLTCDDDGDEDCGPSCSQTCCAGSIAVLEAPHATIVALIPSRVTPTSPSDQFPAAVEPTEIFHVPKSLLV